MVKRRKWHVRTIALGEEPGFLKARLKQDTVACDRNDVEPIQGVNFIKCDIQNSDQVANALKEINQKTDLVLSDIAPNITGIGEVDQANFVDITSNVLAICEQISITNGNLVMKVFNGERLSDIKGLLLSKYRDIVVFKPKSSKKNSSETYIVCNGYKD